MSARVLFGKLPDRADFVRRGAPSPALDALDALAQDALRSGAKILAGPLYRMVYVPPAASDVLVGAVQMSRDRVGRAYPLIAGQALAKAHLAPDATASWPLRWASALDASARLVATGAAGDAPLDAVDRQLEGLPPLPPLQGRAAEIDAHVHALAALPAQALWTRIWGTPDPARIGLVMERLRGARRAPFAYGVRFPLPASTDGFRRADAVAFWLALGWHLLPTPSLPPSVFWTEHDPGALIVFVSGISPSAFRPLLAGTHDPSRIARIDGGSSTTAQRGYDALPPALQRLLASPSLSVADLLGQLHTVR